MKSALCIVLALREIAPPKAIARRRAARPTSGPPNSVNAPGAVVTRLAERAGPAKNANSRIERRFQIRVAGTAKAHE